jgi:hypothetical protein
MTSDVFLVASARAKSYGTSKTRRYGLKDTIWPKDVPFLASQQSGSKFDSQNPQKFNP